MLTTDKQITTPEYWNKVYAGVNNNAKVDASNTKRPANAFDRFSWVAQYAEGPYVHGVASGHAHIEKRIKAAHPDWTVVASDQATEAVAVAKFRPYLIRDAYHLDFLDDERTYRAFDNKWSTLICAQAMEYMDDQEKFLNEAKRVSEKLLITVPLGEMEKWSQLRIYTEQNVKELLQPYGTIEVWERQGDLLLVKLKFDD
jgi:ubiquinone/menaquinone biosynthesis C-methylase UbiE